MLKTGNLTAAFLLSCSFLTPCIAAAAEKPFSGYLFSYFTGNDARGEQVRYSYSTDGKHFTALNGGVPVIDGRYTEMQGLRDPYMVRGQDGLFYATLTDMKSSRGWDSNRGIVLMSSPDLIHWQSSTLNLASSYPNLFPNLKAAWAPQVAYDPLADKNLVYLGVNGNGDWKYKFYSAHTDAAFTRFDEAPRRLFYQQDNTDLIDSDITEKDGKYYLLMKTESTPSKDVKIAVSDHLTWGYTLQTNDAIQQTSAAVEGPQAYKLNDGSGYIVIYDKYNAGGFEMAKTTDFKTFTVVPASDISALYPRHGSVVPLTSEELLNLISNDQNVTVTPASQTPAPHRMLQAGSIIGSAKSTDLGTAMPDNSRAAEIWGLSGDGRVAVGDSYTGKTGNSIRATLWSGPNLSQNRDLGTLKSDGTGASKAYAVSKSSTVIAGIAENNDQRLHATVWSGANLAARDLGTLTSNPKGTSGAYALSYDGGIVAGESSVDSGGTHAALWSGRDWSVGKDLGTLRSDNSGTSWAYALSRTGSVVGGYSTTNYGVDVDSHATLWSGSNWTTKTDLGTLKSSNKGVSVVRALSSDGSIAAGSSSTDSGYTHGAIWSGPNWSQKTDLGTLRIDNSGTSWVRALSADGKIAGGTASSATGYAHGVVWFGNGWAYKTDLGTLKSDGGGVSEVQALSSDGKIAAGYSETDSGEAHAALWKISYPTLDQPQVSTSGQPQVSTSTQPQGVTSTQPQVSTSGLPQSAASDQPQGATSDQPQVSTSGLPQGATPDQPQVSAGDPLPVVKLVDATNSAQTIYQLGAETFEALEAQRHALGDLEFSCQADAGRYCWSVSGGVNSDDNGTAVPTGVTLGLGVSDNLTIGASLAYAPFNPASSAYDDGSSNIGGGVFLDWHQTPGDSQWYVNGALSFSRYDVDIRRPTLSNTEAGSGESSVTGLGASVRIGQNLTVAPDWILGWHVGLKTSEVSRDGYTEQSVDFPVSYDEVSYNTTQALAGADISVPLSKTLTWKTGFEVQHLLNDPSASYLGSAAYIGKVGYSPDFEKLEGSVSTGLKYDFADRMAVSVTASLSETALGDTAFGAHVGFSGKF